MLMVFLITIIGFLFLDFKKLNNKLVMLICCFSSLNEIVTLFLGYTKQLNHIGTLYSISFPLFCLLWMTIFYKNQERKNNTPLIMILFLVGVIINFCWLQGTKNFNYYSAVVGSLTYIGLFVRESFIRLKEENISFILSNRFLLLLSPVLLFFGYGQMFGFVSRDITQSVIFSDFTLFQIVTNFVNVSYYTMILAYILFEKKITRDE